MSNDLPDFLGGEPASEPQAAPTPEPAQPTTAEPAPDAGGPARGPDGKFAAAEPAPTPQPAPAAPQEPTPAHQVPLATFLDQRDRLSAAEKEAKELREWRQAQEAKLQPPPQAPDREADPHGYEAFQQQQIGQALYGQRLEMSRGFAEMKHGPEVTATAFDWGVAKCDQDPFFNEKVRAHRDPVGFVVAEWRRDQALSKVGDPAELDAFLAWKAAQAGGAQPPAAPSAAPAAPPAPPAAPRPSLAGGPSAGAHAAAIPRDGEAQFGSMFER